MGEEFYVVARLLTRVNELSLGAHRARICRAVQRDGGLPRPLDPLDAIVAHSLGGLTYAKRSRACAHAHNHHRPADRLRFIIGGTFSSNSWSAERSARMRHW